MAPFEMELQKPNFSFVSTSCVCVLVRVLYFVASTALLSLCVDLMLSPGSPNDFEALGTVVQTL